MCDNSEVEDMESVLRSLYNKHGHDFKKCKTNLQKIDFFIDKKHLSVDATTHAKNDEKALKFRQLGNEFFRQKEYKQAVEMFTLSIAFAEEQSTASAAFYNRSAALEKMGFYGESLQDIEEALTACPNKISKKLIARRAKILAKFAPNCEKAAESCNFTEICSDKKFGRHLTASKDLQIGEVILAEEPFSAVLMRDFCFYCHHCLKQCHSLKPCTGCTKALFCSAQCQKNSVSYHKHECFLLNKLEVVASHKVQLQLALRITLKLLQNPEPSVRKLLTHSNKRSTKSFFLMSYLAHFAACELKKTDFFDVFPEKRFKALLLTVLQIVDINYVAINRLEPNLAGYEAVRFACGLYQWYSLFNHSCYPNAFFYHDGTKLMVRALATIKKGDQCFVSYGVASKVERQTQLKEKYHFVCSCIACKENWQEEESRDFEEAFVCVQLAIMQCNHELLQTIVPTFVRHLQDLEMRKPKLGTFLRQLVVDCYQIYQKF